MAWQAGVLGSQPSVPVIALTDDRAVCALPRLIASQEMLWLGKGQCEVIALVQCPRPRIRAKFLKCEGLLWVTEADIGTYIINVCFAL
jgi:hypothetical protein